MDSRLARRRSLVRLTAIAIGLVVAGAAGYIGFLAFVGSERDVGAGVMVLGAATGFAAFFSPCSFPLLLTFLTRRSAASRGAAFLSAVRVAAGATLLLAIVAGVTAAGGSAFATAVEFESSPGRVFRLGVGALLVLFGLSQAGLFGVRMRWLDRVAGLTGRVVDPSKARGAASKDLMYGFGYLLAGFG